MNDELNSLEKTLKWQLDSKLDPERLYHLIIAYNRPEITVHELNILGAYKGNKIVDAIIDNYEIFLSTVKSFAILITASEVDEVYNFEVIMPKIKQI